VGRPTPPRGLGAALLSCDAGLTVVESLAPGYEPPAESAPQTPPTDRLRPSRTSRSFYQLLAQCLSESQVQVLHDQSFLRSSMLGICLGDRSRISVCSADGPSDPAVDRNYAVVPVRRQEASIDMSCSVASTNEGMSVTSSPVA